MEQVNSSALVGIPAAGQKNKNRGKGIVALLFSILAIMFFLFYVGPQLEKRLNEGGIFHFWQIAAMAAGDAKKIDEELKLNGRIERDGWIKQAAELLDV